MEDRIRVALQSLIDRGNKNFVIYPYGNYGKITKNILNREFGINELYVVDKKFSATDGTVNIKSIDELRKDYLYDKTFMILVAVDPLGWEASLQVHRTLVEFAEIDRIADILSWSPYFTPWSHYEKIYSVGRPKVAPLECIAREIYHNGITGAVAEAGVFQGETARFINMLFPDRKFYLFDTFAGFNERDQMKDDERNMYNMKLDFSQTSEKIVLDKMHFEKNCIIKKGWFPQSAENINDKFAFVRLDMDLYDPIYAGLEFFYPRMEKGGYILVHDCRSKNFDGARSALIDFCKERNLGYMCMPDNLGSAIISIGM